jgi:phenylalanyl-tRNA synthetase beta chain
MKISYKWLKEFVDVNAEPAEIDRVLTNLGIEIEKIIDCREKYAKFFVGIVTKCEEVEGSDHLHYCEVSTGEELSKVICGAPNVALGQKIVLGKSGAVVPVNGMVLEKRKIRGVESNGMICSKYELGIEEDHSGIWVLPEDAQIGTAISDYLNEDDVIFEISITPNRGDCLSHLGIARELAAYYQIPVNMPALNLKENSEDINEFVQVEIIDPEKNPRYIARLVKNVKIGESPDWLKKRLMDCGLRPINNVVDVTNLVLMEVNQPLHAFDYNKLAGHKIIVRTALDGEKFTTLDSKERILDSKMLMICDAEKPVAVAGVMGGENSEITDQTTNVLIEAAFFNPSSVRRTAKTLGIQSDSSYRFERGVDIEKVTYAASRAAQLIAELSGGEVVSGMVDTYPQKLEIKKINIGLIKLNRVIGLALTASEVEALLKRLYFDIESIDDKSLVVVPPSFRTDITSEIDVIEEVAILYGYDNIPPQFISQIDSNAIPMPENLRSPKLRKKIKNFFVNRGFNEILTQNMIEPAIATKFTDNLVEIANPLGEELSIMRPNILPSFLKSISYNLRVGNHSLKFFEIGKVFNVTDDNSDFIQGIREEDNLMIALSGNTSSKQWGVSEKSFDFYDIKGIISELFDFLKIRKYKFTSIEDDITGFSPNRMSISINKMNFGYFGEVNKDFLKNYDIEKPVFVCILNLSKLYKLEIPDPKYSKISPYPPALRDIAFVVQNNVSGGEILSEIKNTAGNYLQDLNLFDIYEGKQLGEGNKSLAYNLVFSSESKTLTDEEIEPIMQKITERIEKKFSAVIRKF